MLIQLSSPLSEQTTLCSSLAKLIEPQDLEPTPASAARHTDPILLRSRFGGFRVEEPRCTERSRMLGSGAAALFMEQFPKLRALAVDFIPISSLSRAGPGTDARRVLLGRTARHARPILLVEDALLSSLRVLIVRWIFNRLDSAPYTVFIEAANA